MDRFVRRRIGDVNSERVRREFVASPGPNALLEDLAGFPNPPDWAQPYQPLLARWRQASITTKVLLPCAGMDAPGHALKTLGVAFHAFAWDIDPSVGPLLNRVHRSGVDVAAGPIHGDIMRVPLSKFPDVNLLVAGPPCPPWSSMGSGDSFNDPRAQVFWKVCDIIEEQAKRERQGDWKDAFWGFILENVEGILNVSADSRAQGSEMSPMDYIMASLMARLGEGWRLELQVMHSSDWGLPQKRSRPYLRGTKRDLLDI